MWLSSGTRHDDRLGTAQFGGDPVIRADLAGRPQGLLVTPRLDQWAPQWDEIVGRSPLPSPFLRSWWLTGVGGRRRRFLLIVRDDRLLGGLALEEGRRLGLPCLRMMGSGPLCPDHLDLLAAPGHEDTVVQAVRAWLRRPGARLVDLEGIGPGSPLIRALPGRVRGEPLAVAPWARLSVTADTYLAARPPRFRRNFRKARARLTAQGAAYRINRGQSAVRSLETLRRLHSAQWGGRSRFLPNFDRFAAACRLGAEFDEVAVHELHVHGTVIAIMVSFEVAGRVSLYQSARLTDFRWRDASVVLLTESISDACDRGFAEVDLLRGSEAYKRNFAPERRDLLRLRTANAWAGRAGLRTELAVRRAGAAGRRLLPSR
jgi:CelD/BcsL family acetyltransferase involved in cellulose biosynthesis